MFVVKFLKSYGLEKLQEDFAIRIKKSGPLMTLNYSIASPKFDVITKECRGLILDEEFNVVSRSIDRFFNYGEEKTPQPIDFDSCSVYEKIDGSLIKIYFWDKKWNVSTRSIAFADNCVGETEYTYKDLVFLALGGINEEEFQHFCGLYFNTDTTYIFEITSEENRVVTKYEGYSLWFLFARKNSSGEYVKHLPFLEKVKKLIKLPSSFKFKSVEDCIEAAKKFENFEEGFVVCDLSGVPILKIKNPVYVAIHNGIGTGNITRKQMIEMYLNDQVDEYVRYYPEEKSRFASLMESIEKYFDDCEMICETLPANCSQKEFAQFVKQYSWKWIAFEARKKNKNFLTAFIMNSAVPTSKKVQFLTDNLPS